jgi:predicted RNA-binding Zn ribbon-like protein
MSTAVVDPEAVRSAGLKLVGEPLAIDLANTEKLAVDPPLELLPDEKANRVFWHLQSSRVQIPAQLPSLDRTRSLRSAIRSLLESRLAGDDAAAWAVTTVNEYAAAAPIAPQLGAAWSSKVNGAALDGATALLGEVARSAIEVLTGPDANRLHRCAADDCSMLFVATNSKRQWCTAAGCGNRQRVARHAHRVRTAAAVAEGNLERESGTDRFEDRVDVPS